MRLHSESEPKHWSDLLTSAVPSVVYKAFTKLGAPVSAVFKTFPKVVAVREVVAPMKGSPAINAVSISPNATLDDLGGSMPSTIGVIERLVWVIAYCKAVYQLLKKALTSVKVFVSGRFTLIKSLICAY